MALNIVHRIAGRVEKVQKLKRCSISALNELSTLFGFRSFLAKNLDVCARVCIGVAVSIII